MRKTILAILLSISVGILIFLVFGSINGYADEFEDGKEPQFLILDSRKGAGFFSVFFDVVGMLDYYEKGFCTGCEVDFDKTGVYYDSSKGPNWWNYYFSPIRLGEFKEENISKVNNLYPCKFAFNVEFSMSRQRAYELIQRYIKVEQDILNYVDEFYNRKLLNKYVIGVHYRGTDKVVEVPMVPYSKVVDEVNKKIQRNCKIYVATDEKDFLHYMKKTFGKKVVFLKNAIRSSDTYPIHVHCKNPYLQGKEALIDCLMLSKTNLLIRTSSNLSLASTLFNPNLPVIELSKRR